jgi:hypothetical protein
MSVKAFLKHKGVGSWFCHIDGLFLAAWLSVGDAGDGAPAV